jgi:hypothetical protein
VCLSSIEPATGGPDGDRPDHPIHDDP